MFEFFAVSTLLSYVMIQCAVSHARGRGDAAPRPSAPTKASWVSGFEMREGLHFQAGHTWMRVVDGRVVEVGVDDFGARLLGSVERLRLPVLGARVAQGARAFTVRAGPGRTADLASPVTGEVVAVNPRLARNPGLAVRAPYDEGWLCRVRCDDVARDVKNLLAGPLAEGWTEIAERELEFEIDDLAQWSCRDGGDLVPNYASRLDRRAWRRLVAKFFLT